MSAPPGRGPRISAAASRGRSWARILPYPCALEKRLLGDTQTFLGGGGGGGYFPLGSGSCACRWGSGCEQCPRSGL